MAFIAHPINLGKLAPIPGNYQSLQCTDWLTDPLTGVSANKWVCCCWIYTILAHHNMWTRLRWNIEKSHRRLWLPARPCLRRCQTHWDHRCCIPWYFIMNITNCKYIAQYSLDNIGFVGNVFLIHRPLPIIWEDILWTTKDGENGGLVCDGDVMALLMDTGDLLWKCPIMTVYSDETGWKRMWIISASRSN